MKRIVPLLLLLGAVALPAQAVRYKLNLFFWSEYIDPKIIADFERLYDCKVTLDLYEDEDSLMAKLKGGGASQYDLVLPPDHCVPALVKLKLLAPLRQENIPNLRNVDELFLNPPYDRGNVFTVPYLWGTVGLYLRAPKDKPVEETWGLLFDPKLQPGPFVLMDSMRDMIAAALRYAGCDPNSIQPEDLKQARTLLLDAKQRSLGFEGGVGGRNKVLAKTAVLAVAYNGDAARGIKDDPDTRFFVPREGGQMWVDNMAIPAKAPNRLVAEKFIDFILRPDIGARLAEFNKYATPNKAALFKLKPEDLRNPAIYPPPELKKKLTFLRDLGRQTRLYDEVWTQVKAK